MRARPRDDERACSASGRCLPSRAATRTCGSAACELPCSGGTKTNCVCVSWPPRVSARAVDAARRAQRTPPPRRRSCTTSTTRTTTTTPTTTRAATTGAGGDALLLAARADAVARAASSRRRRRPVGGGRARCRRRGRRRPERLEIDLRCFCESRSGVLTNQEAQRLDLGAPIPTSLKRLRKLVDRFPGALFTLVVRRRRRRALKRRREPKNRQPMRAFHRLISPSTGLEADA